LDLSPDERFALTVDIDRRTLTALPVGAGRPRIYPLADLIIEAARWLPDGRTILLVARRPSERDSHLYALGADDGTLRLASPVLLYSAQGMYLSPDGRLVATWTASRQPVLLSVADGNPITALGLQGAAPVGWASPGELWVTRGLGATSCRVPLFRIELTTGRVLEEREVGPLDPTGCIGVHFLAISKDGQDVALAFGRSVGHLFILRGLPLQPR
jgi:hypothetical protein